MSLVGNLADFVTGTDIAVLSPETVTHTKMHILDTIGAMLAGPQTAGGIAIGKFVESLDGVGQRSRQCAAFAASQGFADDEGLLDKDVGPLQAFIKAREKLVRSSPEAFLVTQTALKPYSSSRQALTAIEAFKEILTGQGVDPSSIDAIEVHVPKQYAAMINNPTLPGIRQESLFGVQYQMALAALER
jgi:2-methylcitrate dehydratase PrpD